MQRKATVPKSPEKYFQDTEHAVKHLYAGLDSCWSYYREALKHWDVTQGGLPLTPERREGLDRYLELAGKHFDLKFSEATFAGAILQVAYMGIRLFSRQDSVPSNYTRLVGSTKTAIQFCIGQERHGIPVGLIIYAARHQYNHWDEEAHDVPQNVFRALSAAFHDNMLFDLGFELGNPTITVYASHVLLVALGWTTYDKYLGGMKSMLPGVSA